MLAWLRFSTRVGVTSFACCMVVLFPDAYGNEEAAAVLQGTETCVAPQEIEDAAALQQGMKVGRLERQRKLRWQERLRATQPSLLTQVRLVLPPVMTMQGQDVHTAQGQASVSL